MATEDISFEGMTLTELAGKVTQVASKKDAAILIGGWLVENATRAARTFNYKATFAKTDPACAPKFVRSSAHVDWKDGEDLVQAEQTATEDGFNLRFHRIETDLDALNTDTKALFTCLASLRSNLADRLDDIKTELNLVNADIARLQACCDAHDEGPTLNPDLFPDHNIFVGATHYFGKPVLVFKTPQGTFVLPKVNPVDGPGDPRVKNVVRVAGAFAADKRLARVFSRGAVTKKELIESFGDHDLGDGVTLKRALQILPEDSSFADADALVIALSEREAAAIRSGGAVDELLAIELGFEDVDKVASTGIERFESIPAPVRAGLITIGVNTVGELAAKSGAELVQALGQEGIDVDVGEAAGWAASARVMGMVH
jgi:hypothetical protein